MEGVFFFRENPWKHETKSAKQWTWFSGHSLLHLAGIAFLRCNSNSVMAITCQTHADGKLTRGRKEERLKRNVKMHFFFLFQGAVFKMSSNQSGSALHICIMAKEDIVQTKDCKFQSGLQVSCPYLACNFKNSQFQSAGRFPSEFLLNHLHCNHKHRRFNGDNLDLTMVVPQIEIVNEYKRSGTKIDLSLPNGAPVTPHKQLTTQTWPFVEIFAHKRYFYLEAQSFTIDGHPEIFLWLWFLGKVKMCILVHF